MDKIFKEEDEKKEMGNCVDFNLEDYLRQKNSEDYRHQYRQSSCCDSDSCHHCDLFCFYPCKADSRSGECR